MDMAPRQHPGSDNSVKGTSGGDGKRARATGSDPGYRVSHESVTRKRVTKRTRCEHDQTGASHTTYHKHLSTGVLPAVIPSKGAFSERFEFVEEVVVLATVVEVGVHDDGRGTRDGSGTRSFPERYLTNPTFSGQR